MIRTLRKTAVLSAAGLWFSIPLRLNAGLVYDNTTNDLSVRFDPGTLEVGNEIILSGAERFLTNFSVELWGTNLSGHAGFDGNVEFQIRFYFNDGPRYQICSRDPCKSYFSPGTLFFDTGQLYFLPGLRYAFNLRAGTDFPPTGFYLPIASNMTWTIQFSGLGPNDRAGVDLYWPPRAGVTYVDYWENDPNPGPTGFPGWETQTNLSALPMSFAARMEATDLRLETDSATWSSNGEFSFRVRGTAPWGVIIQSSTDLSNWIPVATNSLAAGQLWYTNAAGLNSSRTFFRAAINPNYAQSPPIGPPYLPMSSGPMTVTSTNSHLSSYVIHPPPCPCSVP